MSIRSSILTFTQLAIFGGFAVIPVQAQDYDLVILNGRIMDPETRYDAVANVGVKDGRFAWGFDLHIMMTRA
jgi:N-acyl-D-amino-acid deacylase